MKAKNIVLIGMPAVGKSTIGVILAKVLGYKYIDSDLVIQERESRLLKDIISEEGIEGFLAIENRINASIDENKSVISTGGSAIYGEDAMRHFRESSVIVYLRVDFEVLSQRLVDIQNRGVVIKDGQTIQDLYQERVPLYEKYADLTIDVSNATISETIEMLVPRLINEL